jgi:hypothetical protein
MRIIVAAYSLTLRVAGKITLITRRNYNKDHHNPYNNTHTHSFETLAKWCGVGSKSKKSEFSFFYIFSSLSSKLCDNIKAIGIFFLLSFLFYFLSSQTISLQFHIHAYDVKEDRERWKMRWSQKSFIIKSFHKSFSEQGNSFLLTATRLKRTLLIVTKIVLFFLHGSLRFWGILFSSFEILGLR